MFVASTHSGETTRSSAAKTSLIAISSKTASRTRSQPAKTSHSVPPVTAEPRKRLAFRETTAAHEVGEFVGDPRDRVVDLFLGQVAQHDRNLQTPQEEQRKLPGHEPCADDADSVNATRLRVGHPDARACASLDEVERVDGGLRLAAREKLRECIFFGSIPSSSDHVAEPSIRSSARYGAGVARAPARRDGTAPCDTPRRRPRGPHSGGACPLLLDLVEQERERLVEELDRLEQHVRIPGLERLRASSMRFCRSGFSTMNLTASSAPTSCGTSCVPPQPGMRPRNTSGHAKWRTDDAIVR